MHPSADRQLFSHAHGSPLHAEGAHHPEDVSRRLAYEARLRRARARRRRRARIRRNRLVAAAVLTAVAAAAWNVVGLFSTSPGVATKAGTAVRWLSANGPTYRVPGALGSFSWPSRGEAAVGLQGAGVMASSPTQASVPIASMTKMMTALLVLRDHPLALGEQGPVLTMTQRDAAAWVRDSGNGDSTVAVRAGERLSEYQLLEAMMLPSADNVADILAAWDAGSVHAFVTEMNSYASTLGLARTVYADPSGVSAASTSTPAEQIIVASRLMKNPVAREIVAMKSASFPVEGTIPNFNPALGTEGIIGVKSGFTHAALGCLAVAARVRVDGRDAMVVAVSTGSIYGLYGAARVDEQLVSEAKTNLVSVSPVAANTSISSSYMPSASRAIHLESAASPPSFVAWRGAYLTSEVKVDPSATARSPGSVGRIVFATPTATLGSVPLHVAAGPSTTGHSSLGSFAHGHRVRSR